MQEQEFKSFSNFLKVNSGNAASACKIWQDYKKEKPSFTELIDLVEFYLCTLNQNKIIFILIALFSLFLIFRLLSFIADEYETPALLKMSEFLRMSNTLASVTLLAFANGAGDVITSIVSGAQSEDITFSLATLYGSGYFVQTLILAFTIL